MPIAAPKPCTVCGVLVRSGGARCDAHVVRAGQFADRGRGSRQARGYGAHWDRLRLQVLRRDNGICQCDECKAAGRISEATQVDHRINKAQWRLLHGSLAGVDDESNLQAINVVCHKRKTAAEAQRGRQREGGR